MRKISINLSKRHVPLSLFSLAASEPPCKHTCHTHGTITMENMTVDTQLFLENWSEQKKGRFSEDVNVINRNVRLELLRWRCQEQLRKPGWGKCVCVCVCVCVFEGSVLPLSKALNPPTGAQCPAAEGCGYWAAPRWECECEEKRNEAYCIWTEIVRSTCSGGHHDYQDGVSTWNTFLLILQTQLQIVLSSPQKYPLVSHLQCWNTVLNSGHWLGSLLATPPPGFELHGSQWKPKSNKVPLF